MYIGKTKRHLGSRIKEYNSKASAILDHILTSNCRCAGENFTVLNKANDDLSLNIKEAFYINKIQPTLNKTLKDQGASYLQDNIVYTFVLLSFVLCSCLGSLII